MNNSISQNIRRYSHYLMGGMALSILVLGSLYAFEGLGARSATPEADAWSCAWMKATPSTVEKGGSTTLSWSFGKAEDGVFVTIKELGSQQYLGTTGSTYVTPPATMTYTAIAHKVGTTKTYTCSTKVTVTEPVADKCDAVEFSIQGNSFTWGGPPALSHYTATFCDGTTSGKVETDHAPDRMTVTLDRPIAKVNGKGGLCHKEVTAACAPKPEPKPASCELTADPTTVVKGGNSSLTLTSKYAVSATIDQGIGQVSTTTGISIASLANTTTYTATVTGQDGKTATCKATVTVTEPQPEWPACPLTEGVIVNFNGKGLRSNGTEAEATSDVYPVQLTAGTYTIKSASWDGYPARVHATQPNEQWKLVLKHEGAVVHTTGATTDLADYVVSSLVTDTLENAVVLPKGVDLFYARHAVYPDKTSPNSVQPICVSFVRHADPTPDPEPKCDISASPLLIEKGASSTITWTSKDATSVSWTGGVSSSDLNGTTVVSPTAKTTYTGTFADKKGKTAICSVTVDVKAPSAAPSCDMNVSASSVVRGSSVTLSWDSTNTKSVTIDQGIGSVATSGSKEIVVQGNTTFTGTFTGDKGATQTCSASVSVRTTGGGGPCLNCDDDDDDDEPRGGGGGGGGGGGSEPDPKKPTIVLSKQVTNPGGYITLDQVPYTGFEAGPVLTVAFWLGVLAVSAALAYVLTLVQPLSLVGALGALNKERAIEQARITELRTKPARVTKPSVFSQAPAHGYAIGDRDDSNTFIENAAHKENILLSPEALRVIATEIERTGADRTAFLTGFFDKAKAEFAREDGWILLSKERTATLVGTSGAAHAYTAPAVREDPGSAVAVQTPAPAPQAAAPSASVRAEVSAPAAPLTSERPTHSFTKAAPVSIATFVGWLVAKEEQKVFEHLRSASAQGGIEHFIGEVVRALDDVYKHRLEGNHNPDAELARLTATWSNGDFEQVLGILVECIDFSYSSNRIGAKVALAKAFEYFRSKTA